MCSGITVYTALKRAEARHGDWVVIAGAGGGLGHLAIQYARELGCRILAMDCGAKEKFCRDLGAHEFVDFTTYPTDEDLTEAIKKITGGGAKIVLMCSSNKRAYVQSPKWLGFRGKLACLGVPEGSSPSIAEVEPMLADELTVFGTFGFMRRLPIIYAHRIHRRRQNRQSTRSQGMSRNCGTRQGQDPFSTPKDEKLDKGNQTPRLIE